MKTILVTGCNGFIGKKLTVRLKKAGHEVIGLDLPDGDIAQKGSLDFLRTRGISCVFHLAAKTFVPDSWKDPFDFYRINLLGTVNVLEFCRNTDCGLTHISSYLYGPPEYLPIDENHPLKAYNPYSQSKILAEESVRFYTEKFNIRATILRPFNIYGPGQPSSFLIGELISKICDPMVSEIEVMDLKPKRDYVFIDDVVEALVLTIDGPKGIYNVGSGYSVSVGNLVDRLVLLSGCSKPIRSKGISRPNEIFELYSDIRLIQERLGWKPETELDEGLSQCIKSFQ